MSGGIAVKMTNLRIDSRGRGNIVVEVVDAAEMKAIVARLHPESIVYDPSGTAHYLSLVHEPARVGSFPAAVSIDVQARKPADGVTTRLSFGNNFLKSGHWVDVISFTPPKEGGAHGELRVFCAELEDYKELRRFVDEPHGSVLRSLDGNAWYVHRVNDDGNEDAPFPQNVAVTLEWRY
jgi:hypothetical protein